jgi:tetratricopeptide (TPR) repeat protein
MKAVRDKQKRGGKPAPPPSPAPVPAAPAPPPVWRKHALIILALWTCALIAYSNSFSGAFVFDNSIVLHDSRIKAVTPENIDLILHQEYWYGWSLTGLYRPLTTFSYLFNYTVLGGADHPAGYHWINFGLHAINIALVYILGLVLLEEIWPAIALAALWALHPLLTESVTNIVGRADLLAGIGVLGGLLCHIRAATVAGWRKAAWLIGLALVTTMGFFSKESTVVVLAAMLLYDLAYDGIRLWRTRVAGYVALAIPLLIYLYLRDEVLSKVPAEQIAFTDNPCYGPDFWTSRFTAVKVIGKYLSLLVWPGTLSGDYSYNQIPLFGWKFGWEDMKAWIALAVCLGALAAAIWCYRRQKAPFFFIFFFFATLAPTSNVFIHIGTIMAERFMYLPSIGYVGCLVVALRAILKRLPEAWRNNPRVAPAVIGVIGLLLLARTYTRNNDYLTDDAFWSKALETSPDSFKTHMGYSMTTNNPALEPTVDRSISEGRKMLAILKPVPDSDKPSAPYINAGMFYREKGLLVKKKFSDPAEGERQARPWFQKSLEPLLEGKRIEAAMNADERRKRWHAGKVLDFGWWNLDIELGRTYLALKDPDKALESFRAGLRRRPMPEFYIEMAKAWRAKGNLRQAAVALMEGLIVDTTNTTLTAGLVEIYPEIDPKGCAVQRAGGANNINLACPMVHEDLCAGAHNAAEYYLTINQRPKAQEVANTAIRSLGCPAEPFK